MKKLLKYFKAKISYWQNLIINHPAIDFVLNWSKRNSLPGFFKVPVFDVCVFLLNEIRRFALVTRANSMAFSFFLALFPALIFLFSLLTHFPLFEHFEGEINNYIDKIMPSAAGVELKTNIARVVDRDTRLLSLGFILTIFFASNGMMALMRGFEKSHLNTFKKRKPLRKRLISIFLTFQMALILVASVILIVLGDIIFNWIGDFLELKNFASFLINLFRWLVTLLLFYSGIAVIYRYGSAMHSKFSLFTPGATLATVLSVLSSILFSFYVESFGTYNKLYGSIGTVIVLMLWIQINSFILLVGFELNASIAENRDLKRQIGEEGD